MVVVCYKVNRETWSRFCDYVAALHGHSYGIAGSELQEALEFYMANDGVRRK